MYTHHFLRNLNLGFLILASCCVLAGCSSYNYGEKTEQCAPLAIETYSLRVPATERLSDVFRTRIRNITRETLAGASEVEANSEAVVSPGHLEVKATITNAHGNGWGLLTGISMGLIPSWESSKGLYVFEFTVAGSEQLQGYSRYTVDYDEYLHLILLPIGLVQLIGGTQTDQYDIYRAALLRAVSTCSGNQHEGFSISAEKAKNFGR